MSLASHPVPHQPRDTADDAQHRQANERHDGAGVKGKGPVNKFDAMRPDSDANRTKNNVGAMDRCRLPVDQRRPTGIPRVRQHHIAVGGRFNVQHDVLGRVGCDRDLLVQALALLGRQFGAVGKQ